MSKSIFRLKYVYVYGNLMECSIRKGGSSSYKNNIDSFHDRPLVVLYCYISQPTLQGNAFPYRLKNMGAGTTLV